MTSTEQLAEDATRVIRHVMCDEDRQYGIYAKDTTNAELIVRVAQTRFNNREELAIVISWVSTITGWTARFRPLSDEEILAHAAARRLSQFLGMFDLIHQLGFAIEAQAWDIARHVWQQLTPFHTLLISCAPEVDLLNVVLHDRQSLAKAASKRVH